MTTETDFDFASILDDTPATPAATANPEPEEPKTERRRATCPDGILFFDLETIPDYSRIDDFDLPPLPTPGPRTPASDMLPVDQFLSATLEELKPILTSRRPVDEYLIALKDSENASKKPRKGLVEFVDKMLNEANAVEAAADERRKTMSVCPEMNRIVSFAWAWSDKPTEVRTLGLVHYMKCHDTFEKCILRQFWEQARRATIICGYNIAGFDLPTIYQRSALLGVEPTRRLDLKPWGKDVCDIMAQRFPKGGAAKLKTFARRLGIKAEAGDVDGSQVETLLETDPEALAKYNRSDVELCRELYLMGRGFWW